MHAGFAFHSRDMGLEPLLRLGVMDAAAVAEEGYRAMLQGRRVAIPGVLNRLQVFSARILPRKAIADISKSMMTPR